MAHRTTIPTTKSLPIKPHSMINKLLTELRRQMNGAVSQTMRELGQKDQLNFGVSLPTIKEIAMRYAPNHDLAQELNKRKSREARIAALYIADPALLTEEQMEAWSRTWETEEIARLSGMLLFYKSPHAESIAMSWIEKTDPLRKISALYITGRIASEAGNGLIEKALSMSDTNSNAAVYCLREIYFAKEEFKSAIFHLSGEIPELRWQITSF